MAIDSKNHVTFSDYILETYVSENYIFYAYLAASQLPIRTQNSDHKIIFLA